MARIFISYKRLDKEKVFAIKDDIESRLGECCWVDLYGIESDSQFANVIIRAIDECEVFLFMYSSSHSKIVDYETDWTIRELTYASLERKRIVFVNIDHSPLIGWFKFMYGTKQQVDWSSDEQSNKLIDDLAKWLQCPTQRAAQTEPTNIKDNHHNEHQAIDLGLPSGLLWATCNIGASGDKPENSGEYFAWGQVLPYIIEDSIMSYDIKKLRITNPGNLYWKGAQLPPSDDAACQRWGAPWRIPSKDDWQELFENTRNEWTELNGVKGCKFISMTNNNNIFLPAAGYYSEFDLNFPGVAGGYWSSTFKDGYSVFECWFNQDSVDPASHGDRLHARPIRPVCK